MHLRVQTGLVVHCVVGPARLSFMHKIIIDWIYANDLNFAHCELDLLVSYFVNNLSGAPSRTGQIRTFFNPFV